MATNINKPFMVNTGLNEHNSLVNLLQNISPAIENEIDIVEHSQYYTDINFINMIQQVNDDVIILNLNCQCLSAKFDRLKLFLTMVNSLKQISCIALQETLLHQHVDLDFYSIPGYNLISEPSRISSQGGVAIYLYSDFAYQRKMVNHSTMFENVAVEI